MSMQFAPSTKKKERITLRRQEIEFLRQFTEKNFPGRPEKRYLDEAYKCYTNQAFGATAVYCGVAVEAMLYEKVGKFLNQGWKMENLLELAKKHKYLDDNKPLGQISEVEVARYILDTRDFHAHHLAGLRPKTKNRYDQVKKDWGSQIPAWFNELEAAFNLPPTLTTMEPYKRTMALEIIKKTVDLLSILLKR